MARGGSQLPLEAHRPLEAEEALLSVAGPFVVAAHSVTSWTMHARPGLVCIYARVSRLSRGGVGERVRQLHAAGLLKMLPQRPAETAAGLFDYRAERTALPYHQARPVPDEAGLSPDARLLMDLLVSVADEGRACPSDRDLSALLGMKSSNQVGRLMAQLRARHLIGIAALPGVGRVPGGRVVTIAATGASTASLVEERG